MKNLFLLMMLLFSALFLSSCFWFGTSTTYPEMVEYEKDEVLHIAKEKYDIQKSLKAYAV